MNPNTTNKEDAVKLANYNIKVFKHLYKNTDYYDWMVVVLFYSICSLVNAVCCVKNVAIPERHKGYYNSKKNEFIEGKVEKVKKYFSQESFDFYSHMLVQSQMLRYTPKQNFQYLEHKETPKAIKEMTLDYKEFIGEYRRKYEE
jgi:hypothetical protein